MKFKIEYQELMLVVIIGAAVGVAQVLTGCSTDKPMQPTQVDVLTEIAQDVASDPMLGMISNEFANAQAAICELAK